LLASQISGDQQAAIHRVDPVNGFFPQPQDPQQPEGDFLRRMDLSRAATRMAAATARTENVRM